MEVLTDILRGLRTTGSVYFCDFLDPPWELDYQDEERAIFHFVPAPTNAGMGTRY